MGVGHEPGHDPGGDDDGDGQPGPRHRAAGAGSCGSVTGAASTSTPVEGGAGMAGLVTRFRVPRPRVEPNASPHPGPLLHWQSLGNRRRPAGETGDRAPLWVTIRRPLTTAVQLQLHPQQGSRPRPRSPTAAAPTRGASPPSPAGRIRVPRAEVEAGPGVDLGLGGGEERRAEAEGHRSGHHRQPEVEQIGHRGHGPADECARPMDHLRGGLGRRPAGDGLDGPARRLALEAAPPAAEAGAAAGFDDDVADVAGIAVPPVEQPPVEHDPAADPGRDDHPDEGARRRPPPRPTPRPGRRPWRRCRRRPAGRSPPPSGAATGSARQAGMWTGVSSSPPAVIGPPEPMPHTSAPPGFAPISSSRPTRAPKTTSASSVRGVGDRRPGQDPAVAGVDEPGGQLRAPDVDGHDGVTHGRDGNVLSGDQGEARARDASRPVRCPGQPRGGRAVRVVGAPRHLLVDGGRDRLRRARRRPLSRERRGSC